MRWFCRHSSQAVVLQNSLYAAWSPAGPRIRSDCRGGPRLRADADGRRAAGRACAFDRSRRRSPRTSPRPPRRSPGAPGRQLPAPRVEGPAADAGRAGHPGARARAAAAPAAGRRFLESVEETRAAIRRLAQAVPRCSIRRAPASPRSARESRAGQGEDRSVRRGGRSRKSGAARRFAIGCASSGRRLRGTLESYLRGKDTAKYLQDQVVTERNGRYVLVVKAEHRSNIPGIVHGASASGASLFLEPLSTVEINNDIVALEQQEAEEVHRILLALTDAFRSRRRGGHAHDRRGDRARRRFRRGPRYSQSIDGVEPRPRDRRRVRAARGAPSAAEVAGAGHDQDCCRRQRRLLITGPNTGGKTVA